MIVIQRLLFICLFSLFFCCKKEAEISSIVLGEWAFSYDTVYFYYYKGEKKVSYTTPNQPGEAFIITKVSNQYFICHAWAKKCVNPNLSPRKIDLNMVNDSFNVDSLIGPLFIKGIFKTTHTCSGVEYHRTFVSRPESPYDQIQIIQYVKFTGDKIGRD